MNRSLLLGNYTVLALCLMYQAADFAAAQQPNDIIREGAERDEGLGEAVGRSILQQAFPHWGFKQHGESGLWISDLFPNLVKYADELCLLRGMHCDQPAHAQAFLQMHTGHFQFVRPSMGAWTLYGLGTENQNLPGFISINPPTGNGGAQNYGSAFLPAAFQGTKFTVQDSSARNRRIDQLRRGEVNPYGINNAVNEQLSKTA